MKVIALLAAAALPSVDAPPWERADVWLCKAETYRSCKYEGECETSPGQAVVTIDFKEGLYKVFGAPSGYRDTIIQKRYWKPIIDGEHGSTRISLSSGGTVSMDTQPENEVWTTSKDAYRAILSAGDVKSTSIHYAICRPSQ